MKTVELPEELKKQIEPTYIACSTSIPDTELVRVTDLETFTRLVEQLLKLAYIQGILDGLKQAKEIANRPETQY